MKCKYPGCITIISDLNRNRYRDSNGNLERKGKLRKYCFVHQRLKTIEKREKYVTYLGKSRDRHGVYESKASIMNAEKGSRMINI
jgi:hypothetical protein